MISSATAFDFSNLVDVDIRSGDDGLDDSLAIEALAIASSFKCLSCLTEGETGGTVSKKNFGLQFSEHTGVTRVA